MNTKAELIVLNHTKFGENTIILHTLSNEYGRRGFLVRAGAKSSMALFLPMNILEAEISENPKSQLWKASNFVCLSPLNGIRGDIRKNTMTVFMSEVLYRAILEDTNEGGLASWLKQEILTLDALKSDFSNFHLLFLLDLCSALGFSPSLPGLAPFAGTQLSNIEALLRNYYRDSQGFSSRDGNSQSASLQDGLPQSSSFQDGLPQSSSSGQAFPIFFLAGRFPRFLGRTRKSTLAATPRRRSQRNRRSHHPLHFLPHRNQSQYPIPCHPPRNLRVIILSHLTIKTAPRHFRIARRLSLKIQDRSATLAGWQQCTSHSQLIQSHKVVRGASVSG